MNRREKASKRAKDRRLATPATPVHRWKQTFSDYQLYEAGLVMATPSEAPPPSARKLASSLWELQDLPLPICLPASLYSPDWIPWNSPSEGNAALPSDSPFSQPDYVLAHCSSKADTPRHRKTGAQRGVQTHLQRLLTKTVVDPGDESAHAPSTPTLVDRRRHIPSPIFATTGKGEIDGTLTTSQELLKVFSQIRLLEEQHTTSLSLTTALQEQLMEAHSRVMELEIPQRVARREKEGLMKRFSDEKKSWKAKEKEAVRAAVQPVKEELDEERKAKQRVESANRRLMKELAESQAVVAKLVKELDSERKAREAVEEICHDLVREKDNHRVGEMEELKRAREELEEERRMLQTAELIREERVQMKLGEASLALETKSAALDDIRAELEAFLANNNGDAGRMYDSTTFRDAQVLHKSLSAVHYDTSISTFPPLSSMSSISSTASFPPTSEYVYAANMDTDSSQGSRNRGHALLFYPEGIPDAD